MPAKDPEEAIKLGRELILKFAESSGVKYLTKAEVRRIMALADHFSDRAEILRNQ